MPKAADTHPISSRHCSSCCVLRCQSPSPAPLLTEPDAQVAVLLDYPIAVDTVREQLLSGRIGKRLRSELAALGINRLQVGCRIACTPPPAKRTDQQLSLAARACTYHQATWQSHLPLLALGKYATNVLGYHSITLRSGAEIKLPVAKLAKHLPMRWANRWIMVGDSPAYTFWGKPSIQAPLLAALKRFADRVLGRQTLAPPPPPEIHVTERTLALLGRMGPEIGWDVETLGVDPLTAPITCIGISDGQHTISVPWETYSTARQSEVLGVNTATRGLPAQIRQAVLNVLHSDRLQITQNGSYDVLAMQARGLPGRNDWDIMHAYAVLWPECPKTLEAIALHVVPNVGHRWKSIFRAGRDDDAKGADVYAESAAEDLREYNGYDACYTALAKRPLEKLLATED